METTEIIGYCAAFLTTLSFVPQAYKTIKTKQTKDISLVMYIMFFIGLICWLVYGFIKEAMPIIMANIVTISLVIPILYMKIRYK